MSKRRIPSHERKPSRSTRSVKTKSAEKTESPEKTGGDFIRYLGLSLSGGKSDKSCLAVVDFYREPEKIFLNRIVDRVKAEEFISADLKIHELIQQFSDNCEALLLDAPLTLPPAALACKCKPICTGYETCEDPQIQWMRKIYQRQEKAKPKKFFTPYTQRALELYLQESPDIQPKGAALDIQHALGANLAPITMRAQYICRRITLPCLEVLPKLSVWRLGKFLKVAESHLRSYRNSVGGEDARRIFLTQLAEKTGVFIYRQDLKLMIENCHAFEAFICAYMGVLGKMGKLEPRPKDFPKSEIWLELPKTQL